MALVDSEIQSLRFHLGYGNINAGAAPYTADGFLELFTNVVAPNLQTAPSTTGSTAVVAGTTVAITLAAITGIIATTSLFVDVGDDSEIVIAKAISGLTFTATFTKAHGAAYPVAVVSGESRLRRLLWQADLAWQKLQDAKITNTAGLKQLGRGKIEWFQGGAVLSDTTNHYHSIVQSIADLVRVTPAWGKRQDASRSTELY